MDKDIQFYSGLPEKINTDLTGYILLLDFYHFELEDPGKILAIDFQNLKWIHPIKAAIRGLYSLMEWGGYFLTTLATANFPLSFTMRL